MLASNTNTTATYVDAGLGDLTTLHGANKVLSEVPGDLSAFIQESQYWTAYVCPEPRAVSPGMVIYGV